MLSPLLFIIVMEAVTQNVREGLPWEMLYTDDLVLVGKCEEELKEKLRKWNECLKDKGLKINEDKTKVMCESFGTCITQVVGNMKHPCSVCLKGVGVNSISCTQCIQWVHARYSRVKGSLKNVESSFICRCKGELYETRQVNGLHIDVVLRHTLPIFTGLGRYPIISWDFAGAVSIFGPDALPVVHQ